MTDSIHLKIKHFYVNDELVFIFNSTQYLNHDFNHQSIHT